MTTLAGGQGFFITPDWSLCDGGAWFIASEAWHEGNHLQPPITKGSAAYARDIKRLRSQMGELVAGRWQAVVDGVAIVATVEED